MKSHRSYLLIVAAQVAFGCAHSHQVTWRIQSPDQMKQVVQDSVPLGSSIAQAREFMESEGFECEVRKNSTFYERRSWTNRDLTTHKKIDFLNCHRNQSAGQFGLRRIWNVALVLNDEAVSEAIVSHYVDGL